MEFDTFVRGKKESLYVIEFDSGIIKVGRGYSPEQRIKIHRQLGEIAGWKLTKIFSIECHVDVKKAEKRLISICLQSCTEVRAREWFLGLDFDAIVNSAKDCAQP